MAVYMEIGFVDRRTVYRYNVHWRELINYMNNRINQGGSYFFTTPSKMAYANKRKCNSEYSIKAIKRSSGTCDKGSDCLFSQMEFTSRCMLTLTLEMTMIFSHHTGDRKRYTLVQINRR